MALRRTVARVAPTVERRPPAQAHVAVRAAASRAASHPVQALQQRIGNQATQAALARTTEPGSLPPTAGAALVRGTASGAARTFAGAADATVAAKPDASRAVAAAAKAAPAAGQTAAPTAAPPAPAAPSAKAAPATAKPEVAKAEAGKEAVAAAPSPRKAIGAVTAAVRG